MGRFDALTHLDTKLVQHTSLPVDEKARKPAYPQDGKPARPQEVLPAQQKTRKPARPHAGKPANPQTHVSMSEQVEKYTTRLEPSLIKEIKVYAAQHDLADYEVVKQAVTEYLARKK